MRSETLAKRETMKATNKNLQSHNIGAKRDKIADKFYRELAVIHSEHGAVARFRFYCTGQTIHCIAWLGSRDLYGSGYGRAGGYGYDKASAAMADAIDHAGIKLSKSMALIMNKYLRLHIDQASKATRRHYNVARIVTKLIGMIIAAYVVMLGLWWCITVFFAITP